MSPVGIGIVVFLILLAVLLIVTNVKIVPQSRAYVVERLGAYRETWQTGIHLKIPFFERIARNVSLKEQVVDFPPQPVITKDNVTMQIDTVVFYQIKDPNTASKARFRQSKIFRQQRFVTSSVSLSLTILLHQEIL